MEALSRSQSRMQLNRKRTSEALICDDDDPEIIPSSSNQHNTMDGSSPVPSTTCIEDARKAASLEDPGEIRGDPRMNKAVQAKLKNPHVSLSDALRIGGFEYPPRATASAVDSENVTLGQRKNQLNRRLRQARLNKAAALERREAAAAAAVVGGGGPACIGGGGGGVVSLVPGGSDSVSNLVSASLSWSGNATVPSVGGIRTILSDVMMTTQHQHQHQPQKKPALIGWQDNIPQQPAAIGSAVRAIHSISHHQPASEIVGDFKPAANIIGDSGGGTAAAIIGDFKPAAATAVAVPTVSSNPAPALTISAAPATTTAQQVLINQPPHLLDQLLHMQSLQQPPPAHMLQQQQQSSAASDLMSSHQIGAYQDNKTNAPSLIPQQQAQQLIPQQQQHQTQPTAPQGQLAVFSAANAGPGLANQLFIVPIGQSDSQQPMVQQQQQQQQQQKSSSIPAVPAAAANVMIGSSHNSSSNAGASSRDTTAGHQVHAITAETPGGSSDTTSPPDEGLNDERLQSGLNIFGREIRQLYQTSMLRAGFTFNDCQESSQTYHNFAFHAWRRECQTLQRLIKSDAGSANSGNANANASSNATSGANTTGSSNVGGGSTSSVIQDSTTGNRFLMLPQSSSNNNGGGGGGGNNNATIINRTPI